MINNELIKIGLTEKESRIYLAILELGEANIQKLAIKAQIKRTTTYDILESLKQKGFIGTTTTKKRKLYFAQNPKKLEIDLEEKKSIVKNIMPELLAITNKIDKKPTIKYFEGMEGIKEIYKDNLNYKEQEMLSWLPEKYDYETLGNEFIFNFYVPKRIEKKIWIRAIAPDNELNRRLQKEDEKSLRKTKLAKFSVMPNVDINLYGKSKISILSYEEKFGLIIESQKIYDTLKGIFEMNWAML